jgi:hypothetical protein
VLGGVKRKPLELFELAGKKGLKLDSNSFKCTVYYEKGLSLRNTFFRPAETDFSEHPEKVTEPKHNGFSETAPEGLF